MANEVINGFEVSIGLEVHVELLSKTKIFCGCLSAFGGRPNTNTCPVCLGMPGAYPVLNKKVVEMAISAGLYLDCEISHITRFDRKNYFYPDNPQNYQISQLYLPICKEGRLPIEINGRQKDIRIIEMHMEEDAGKLIHEGEDTLIDYNRAGVPLLEIVSYPDMSDADEAIAYLEKLKMYLGYLGISDCKMQEGSMRADVNLSVKRHGEKKLGTRTEMKNLSSFKAIKRAIAHEARRQADIINSGEKVLQETRRWDDAKGMSFPMRGKETQKDYRYFPDPDLAPVAIDKIQIDKILENLPETPEKKKQRFIKEYFLSGYDADIITSDRAMADFFEKTSSICHEPKKVANYLIGENMRLMRENGLDAGKIPFSAKNLSSLIKLEMDGKINGTVAKQVFEKIFYNDIDPVSYVEENGLLIITDEGAIKIIIDDVISENEKSVLDYKNGKKKAIGYLIGQVMKKAHGRADAAIAQRMLIERIEGG